ncbi:MAG: hypothetical protein ACOY0T_07970 [Myxococcota bacterium]
MKLEIFASSLILSAAMLGFSQPAQAQTSNSKESGYETRSESATSSTYEVRFIDDPLDALPASSYIARIRVATGRVRVLLARPRTSFVNEMLVSVEAL